MNYSELYVVVIELFNKNKEILSLNMAPAGRGFRTRKSGVRELKNGLT